LALEHGELLPEDGDLKRCIASIAGEDTDYGQERKEHWQHVLPPLFDEPGSCWYTLSHAEYTVLRRLEHLGV